MNVNCQSSPTSNVNENHSTCLDFLIVDLNADCVSYSPCLDIVALACYQLIPTTPLLPSDTISNPTGDHSDHYYNNDRLTGHGHPSLPKRIGQIHFFQVISSNDGFSAKSVLCDASTSHLPDNDMSRFGSSKLQRIPIKMVKNNHGDAERCSDPYFKDKEMSLDHDSNNLNLDKCHDNQELSIDQAQSLFKVLNLTGSPDKGRTDGDNSKLLPCPLLSLVHDGSSSLLPSFFSPNGIFDIRWSKLKHETYSSDVCDLLHLALTDGNIQVWKVSFNLDAKNSSSPTYSSSILPLFLNMELVNILTTEEYIKNISIDDDHHKQVTFDIVTDSGISHRGNLDMATGVDVAFFQSNHDNHSLINSRLESVEKTNGTDYQKQALGIYEMTIGIIDSDTDSLIHDSDPVRNTADYHAINTPSQLHRHLNVHLLASGFQSGAIKVYDISSTIATIKSPYSSPVPLPQYDKPVWSVSDAHSCEVWQVQWLYDLSSSAYDPSNGYWPSICDSWPYLYLQQYPPCSNDATNYQTSLLISGSDDCSFKLWDIRRPGSRGPVIKNTTYYQAGITCFSAPLASGCSSAHQTLGNMLLIGSYDETVSVWDLRNMEKCPVFSQSLGGGIWRLKFKDNFHKMNTNLTELDIHDSSIHPILAASCMYDGFKVIQVDCQKSLISILAHYTGPHSKGDPNLAYGIDWVPRYMNNQKKSLTSPRNELNDEIQSGANMGKEKLRGGNKEKDRRSTSLLASCSFYDNMLSLWQIS